MKVSQVQHCMYRDEVIHIIDSSLPINKMTLFYGKRQALHKDNELNKRHVCGIWADEDDIVLDVAERRKNDAEVKR